LLATTKMAVFALELLLEKSWPRAVEDEKSNDGLV
jgi:hypothetical protein